MMEIFILLIGIGIIVIILLILFFILIWRLIKLIIVGTSTTLNHLEEVQGKLIQKQEEAIKRRQKKIEDERKRIGDEHCKDEIERIFKRGNK